MNKELLLQAKDLQFNRFGFLSNIYHHNFIIKNCTKIEHNFTIVKK